MRVIPRSSVSAVIGMQDGVLRIKVKARPVDGAANTEVVRLLAKTFGVSKSEVAIVSGETSKTKLIRIDGVSQTDLDRVLRA